MTELDFVAESLANCETSLRMKAQTIAEAYIATLRDPLVPAIAAMVKDYVDAREAYERADAQYIHLKHSRHL